MEDGQAGKRGVYLDDSMTIKKGRGDINTLRLFRRARLADTPKSRRLQFMKTRFRKMKCAVCGVPAHYMVSLPRRKAWCKGCFPSEMRVKLDITYQYVTYIMPLADYLDGHRY